MICHPYLVSTTLEISPLDFKPKAAFSKSIELIWPLVNLFNTPPLKEEFLSSENFFASFSKLEPLFSESKIDEIISYESVLFLYFIM